jgi:hypothetical protein
MGLYRRLYPQVETTILDPLRSGRRQSIHGSEVRDAFISGVPGIEIDDRAERLLVELVDEGVLQYDSLPAPTLSQAAFFGLGRCKTHPGWVPGTVEHFRYRLSHELFFQSNALFRR